MNTAVLTARAARPVQIRTAPRGTGKELAPRELQILDLVAQGCTNREIAARLSISEDTVKTFLTRANRKLGAHNRAHAVALAARYRLIDVRNVDPR